jgi:amino acid transporter
MLPKVFATLHPRYRTPSRAILLIGAISMLAPLLGRPMLVWLVNSGGLGIVVAYLFVAISFVVLRRREPAMPRPYEVRHGQVIGILGALLSVGFILIYLLPFSPSALTPLELAMFFGWMALGFAMYFWSVRRYGVNFIDETMRAALERTAR